ncbi:hypothetical protein GUJ93_ZPchr0002g24069 [Zizania palustris]|uniref:Uncharacterized protein n=1 Tax=Zizania palustris TaxID=103762 RepID=A0A8J5VUM8_ZIZPA|nr:hypothetical protein GUJ93_ZPchr0002g24069 [Zizania palustris]
MMKNKNNHLKRSTYHKTTDLVPMRRMRWSSDRICRYGSKWREMLEGKRLEIKRCSKKEEEKNKPGRDAAAAPVKRQWGEHVGEEGCSSNACEGERAEEEVLEVKEETI